MHSQILKIWIFIDDVITDRWKLYFEKKACNLKVWKSVQSIGVNSYSKFQIPFLHENPVFMSNPSSNYFCNSKSCFLTTSAFRYVESQITTVPWYLVDRQTTELLRLVNTMLILHNWSQFPFPHLCLFTGMWKYYRWRQEAVTKRRFPLTSPVHVAWQALYRSSAWNVWHILHANAGVPCVSPFYLPKSLIGYVDRIIDR